jgi:uncharacterized protein (TIGR02466 family)
MKEIERLNLFPTPVFKFNTGRKPSDEEKAYVEECSKDTYLNVGNVVSVDRYVLDRDPMFGIRESVQFALDSYLKSVYDPSLNVKIYITQSWLNFTNPGQHHHPHSHPNSFLSGTFYFSADKNQDSISFFNTLLREFILPPESFNEYNAERWVVPVETGDIVVFPSNLKHCVDDTVKERTLTRISVAFNTFLSGQIGDEMHLTSLRLKP